MDKPNFEHFQSTTKVKLTPFQKELAKALIEARNIYHSGGLRSGRTTVINALDEYYKKFFKVPFTMR